MISYRVPALRRSNTSIIKEKGRDQDMEDLKIQLTSSSRLCIKSRQL